jgi:hypothetical protein
LDLSPLRLTQRAFFCLLHAALHVDKPTFWDHYPSTKIQATGKREDRETRIGIDRGFFLWVLGNWAKKSPLTRSGLKSILWEGGGDRDNYSEFLAIK